MFEIRSVRRYRDPAYPCMDDDASHSSFFADVARPMLPVAFAALTLTAVVDDDPASAPSYCSTLDDREARSPSPRPVKRLTEESVAQLIMNLDAPVFYSSPRGAVRFGTGEVSICFLTGAEISSLIKALLTLNGITDEQERLYYCARDRSYVTEPQFPPDVREREIAKIRNGEPTHIVGPGFDRSVRERGSPGSYARRDLANRVLLEMERFLEWLDRNGYARAGNR